MKANLHLHSRFSDGSLWPEDIAQSAAHEGLALAALTDHDTLGGSERFAAACGELGVETVTACEIDVSEPEIGYKSELLGYFPGKGASSCRETRRMLGVVLGERKKRLEYYLYWARTIFRREDLTIEDLLKDKIAGGEPEASDLADVSWSKVDLFLYLKTKKLLPAYMTYKLFKKEWFAPGKFPKYKLSKPNVRDCARSIRADGGCAVIPHFGHLWNDDIEEMERKREAIAGQLQFFRACGVEGIELYWYSGHKKTQAINDFVRRLAEPLGFFFTYGSDCHGPGTDKCTIDKFSGDFAGFPPR
jgi:hypothetical protein